MQSTDKEQLFTEITIEEAGKVNGGVYMTFPWFPGRLPKLPVWPIRPWR